ncbi:MAG: AraC family transcriptional regulator [Phycisphaerae bacterium]
MKRLPEVVIVRVNRPAGPKLAIGGSFTDPEYVFHYIKSGKWSFCLRSEIFSVSPGNLVLLPPGLLHGVRSADPRRGGAHGVIHFRLVDAPPELTAAPYVVAVDRATQRLVAHHFELMLQEFARPRLYGDVRLAALTTELLALYLRNASGATPAQQAGLPLWPQVEHALRLIQQRYADPSLGLRDMAAAAGLSISHFSAIFQRYTGYSPYLYLTRLRIERAQNLLLQGQFNCSQIARQVGFASIHVFSKAFSRMVSLSPRQWLDQEVR